MLHCRLMHVDGSHSHWEFTIVASQDLAGVDCGMGPEAVIFNLLLGALLAQQWSVL